MSIIELEIEIKKLFKSYSKNRNKQVKLKIEKLLFLRKIAINDSIIFNSELIKYIIQVNQVLNDKSTLMIKKADDLKQKMLRVKELGDDFLDDFEIEYSIKIEHESENLRCVSGIIDDLQSDYDSMAEILYELDLSGMNFYIMNTKEIDNWNNEVPLSLSGLNEIKFCYASHELFCHGLYSILDIIRINFFWTEISVKWQNLHILNIPLKENH